MADGRGEPLLSVERSIEVLELFTSRRTTLSLAEMQELLPWPRTTLHRYAHSLRHTGMLSYDTRAGRYRLGPKLVRLGTAALNGLPLAELAGPYLEELVRLTHVTALLTIWDGDAPLVIRENDNTDQLVSLKIREGSHLPAYDSAAGQVFLAFSPAARERPVRADLPAAALAERERTLTAVRDDGLAYTEVLPGLRAFAAPVFQADELVGAISILGTVSQLPEPGRSAPTEHLLDICRRLTAALGAGMPGDRTDDVPEPPAEE
ncbi:IclR family transcriptional regulator [Streptomyces sp. NBC_01476]|uniref:IclR family transcriptional regulator n=1 Tax=Streptomyces sp. NBC_01476 TaxID=2903881 RepID=UPI002E2F74E6|nr:IclR family transcriptional regulator [Streptomyces sp. NBC_01476]